MSLASDESTVGGIRAKIRLPDLASCPVAQVSNDGVECFNVSKRVDPESGQVTEEFATDATAEVEAEQFEPVFSYGEQSVYRFKRRFGHDCACELVEEYDVVRKEPPRLGGLFLLSTEDGGTVVVERSPAGYEAVDTPTFLMVYGDVRTESEVIGNVSA